ncbi:MAG: DciA family protein [Zoogloeaceae bacterium]|nr:DciA family protein [Zoogloeaceae bacterium]
MSKSPRLATLSERAALIAPLAHAKQLWEAQTRLEKTLPPYLRNTRIANYQPPSGRVVLHADNAALAAKLRQLAGRLKNALVSMGWQCNEIEIRIQPDSLPKSEKNGGHAKPLSAGARASLAACAAQLPDDAPTKAALAELLALSA